VWSEFFDVADAPEEIGVHRPFYPRSGLPKGTRSRAQLTEGLGLSWPQLLRRCERAQPERREACSLFWTLGGNQVGKGALSGWRLLRGSTHTPSYWPFDGTLEELVRPGRVVVTETYPAEAAHHIGIGEVRGKQQQSVRRSHADALLKFAHVADIVLAAPLRALIEDGFGPSKGGEDPFDAVIGLFGMINVLAGRRPAHDPDDDAVRSVEGWILGQAPLEAPARGAATRAAVSSRSAAVTVSERDQLERGSVADADTSLSTSWATEPVDQVWLQQVVVLVEHAIDQLVLEFVALPFLHRVEHSLNCELYALLTANRTLGRPYQLADGTWTQLVHKEWPESVARPEKAGRRGNFDMVVLDRAALERASVSDFQRGLIKPAIVIEVGLNYGAQHLRADVDKLRNSAVERSYVVHLARHHTHHHPDLVDELHQPSVQIAAALAGAPRPTYRLLQRQS
jgi:hypothetical protein